MCKNSALSGVQGVSVGDELTAVDDCQVRSVSEWTECTYFFFSYACHLP